MRSPARLLVLCLIPILAGCGGSALPENDGIIEFPDEGAQHVAEGTPIAYNTDPPTSGTHYPIPQPGGFYTQAVQPGYLVHTMEHGGIVIYYDPATVTEDQRDELRAIIQPHLGNFSTVAAVPRDDPAFPIILTAWRHRQRLQTYDANQIRDFIDLFLGRGPENP